MLGPTAFQSNKNGWFTIIKSDSVPTSNHYLKTCKNDAEAGDYNSG